MIHVIAVKMEHVTVVKAVLVMVKIAHVAKQVPVPVVLIAIVQDQNTVLTEPALHAVCQDMAL